MVAVTPSHRYHGLLLSKRADIFALGSTMFEVLYGQTPYEGCTDKEIKDLFKKSKFPVTKHLGPIGDIIKAIVLFVPVRSFAYLQASV